VAELARREFRHLAIFARARNRHHAHLLMDIGLDGIIRETFFSSLRMSELILGQLGIPQDAARRAIELFQAHDERNLQATRGIAGDEQRLIQSAQAAAEELQELFESDLVTQPFKPGSAT
jgi:CPA2 family monovalent cation:H+ antiporter-2/glutathione-regulated potassium-efflux system protein KefB